MGKHRIKALAFGAAAALLASTAVYAGTWQKDSNGWWYLNDDGTYVRSQWMQDRGKWYYFNSKGYMLADATTPDGYVVGSDGALVDSSALDAKNGRTIDEITIVPTGCRIDSYQYSEAYDRKLTMSYKIVNRSEASYGYAFVGWKAVLQNGVSLKNWTDIQEAKLNQVAPKTSKSTEVSFLVPKDTAATEITVSYNFMDYDKEFWKDYNAVNEGALSSKEYSKKYSGKEIMTFQVPVS